jgi:CubicO group peptidase (beta-lactamase class C family)
VAATPETLFNWWSITKVLTAVAVLQLCEKSRLHLDDNVSHHLPFFQPRHTSHGNRPVTVGHLLNHSSGIADAGLATYGWIQLKGNLPSQRVFAGKVVPRQVRLQFEPGRKGIYTNFGYLLLGALIETVTGIDYQEYLRQHILAPLQMNETVFNLGGNAEPRVARGSHPIFDFQTILLPALGNFPAYIREVSDAQIWFERFQFNATACGGLIGPATDAARFMRAYLNGGELDGARILTEKSVAYMSHEGYVVAGRSQQSRLYPGMSYGVGWFVIPSDEGLCLQHTGFGPGFASIMRLYPEAKLGIVVLSNGSSLKRNRTVDLLAGLFGAG